MDFGWNAVSGLAAGISAIAALGLVRGAYRSPKLREPQVTATIKRGWTVLRSRALEPATIQSFLQICVENSGNYPANNLRVIVPGGMELTAADDSGNVKTVRGQLLEFSTLSPTRSIDVVAFMTHVSCAAANTVRISHDGGSAKTVVKWRD
jgi:hypothetical protein